MSAPAVSRASILPRDTAHWHALRAEDVTSTESAALFGLSPYCTHLDLWHRKKEGGHIEIPANERMAWGNRLQDAAALGIAEDGGVMAVRAAEYARIVDARMGASFDYRIDGWRAAAELGAAFTAHGPGLLEIKCVDFLVWRDQWPDMDGRREAPGHIEIQLQHQLHVADLAWGAFGVLVSGNKTHVLIRQRYPDVGEAIEERIRQFWKSIEADTPPPPVWPEDVQTMARINGYAEPGKFVDLRGDSTLAKICREYRAASEIESKAKADKETAREKIRGAMGDAERAEIDGFKVSAAVVGPCHVEYDREGFRGFRLTEKKEKRNG